MHIYDPDDIFSGKYIWIYFLRSDRHIFQQKKPPENVRLRKETRRPSLGNFKWTDMRQLAVGCLRGNGLS